MQDAPIKLAANFQSIMKTVRQWDDMFKVLKENKSINQETYTTKLFFKNEEKIKTFPTWQLL